MNSILCPDLKQFTAAEIEWLSQLDLPDPDPEEVQQTLREHGLIDQQVGAGHEGNSFLFSQDAIKPEQKSTLLGSIEDGSATKVPDGSFSKFHKFPNPPQQSVHSDRKGVVLADFLMSRPGSASVGRLASPVTEDVSKEIESSSAPVSRGGLQTPGSLVLQPSSSRLGNSGKRSIDISLNLLPKRSRTGDNDTVAEALLQTRHVDFIDQGLTTTLPIETFLNATHVYIQNNLIEELDGLQLLYNLQVLVVHHNQITSLQPLGVFPHLSYVDASFNVIGHINFGWDLPRTLSILDLRNNPCCPLTPQAEEEYRHKALSACPKLVELDGKSTEADEESSSEEEEAEAAHRSEKNLSETTAPKADNIEIRTEQPMRSGTGDLVSTPPRQSERARRSPGVSSVNNKLKNPSWPSEKSTKTLCQAPSTGQNKGISKAGRGPKRTNIVDEVRAARGVKFALPDPEEPEEPVPEGRSPSSHIPYPTYKCVSLEKENDNDEWTLEDLSAPVNGMLNQYTKRSEALITALRKGADDVDPATAEEDDNSASEELRLAREVKNRARSDLDYACTVIGHQSRRAIEEIHADVGKVMRTRESLVAERQRRIEGTKNEYSAAYCKALELLKKEQHTKDLDKYRKRKMDSPVEEPIGSQAESEGPKTPTNAPATAPPPPPPHVASSSTSSLSFPLKGPSK